MKESLERFVGKTVSLLLNHAGASATHFVGRLEECTPEGVIMDVSDNGQGIGDKFTLGLQFVPYTYGMIVTQLNLVEKKVESK